MAGLYIRYNPLTGDKDELAGKAFTNDNGIFKPTPAISHVLTPAPVQTPVLAQVFPSTPAPASVSGPSRRYTKKNL